MGMGGGREGGEGIYNVWVQLEFQPYSSPPPTPLHGYSWNFNCTREGGAIQLKFQLYLYSIDSLPLSPGPLSSRPPLRHQGEMKRNCSLFASFLSAQAKEPDSVFLIVSLGAQTFSCFTLFQKKKYNDFVISLGWPLRESNGARWIESNWSRRGIIC